MSHRQGCSRTVSDFTTDLKTLFVESYPGGQITSAILLQRFLMGSLPTISCQLLLKGKPTLLERAVVDPRDIEFAFAFEPPQD